MKWLKDKAPSLGEIYEGAVIMLSKDHFPGRTRFISHAVREICNQLPERVNNFRKGKRVQYVQACEKIVELFEKDGLSLDLEYYIDKSEEKESPSKRKVEIPVKIYKEISKLLNDHKNSRENIKEKNIRFFEGISTENQNLRNQLRPFYNQWSEICKFFQSNTHDSGKVDEDISFDDFKKKFELFEDSLLGLVKTEFFKGIEEIDEVLEETNK